MRFGLRVWVQGGPPVLTAAPGLATAPSVKPIVGELTGFWKLVSVMWRLVMGGLAGPDPVYESGLGIAGLGTKAALQSLWLHSNLLQLPLRNRELKAYGKPVSVMWRGVMGGELVKIVLGSAGLSIKTALQSLWS